MNVNLPGLTVDDNQRQLLQKSIYGKQGHISRHGLRFFAMKAVEDELAKHGVTVKFHCDDQLVDEYRKFCEGGEEPSGE